MTKIFDKFFKRQKIFLLLITIMLLIPFVGAFNVCNSSDIELKSSLITDNSFKLIWNNTDKEVMDLYKNNELIISNYTLNQTVFSELKGDSLYEIMLFNGTCVYIKDITTLKNNSQQLDYYLNAYLYFIIAVLITIMGIVFRSKIIMVIPTLIMVYGFVNNVFAHTGYQILIVYGFGLVMVIFLFIAV